jgi:hypothetical protein
MGLLDKLKDIPLMCSVKYVGGFPEWNSNLEMMIKVYNDNRLVFCTLGKTFIESNLSDIDVSIENERQFSERVTVTRLLLVGIFAFAFKKKQNIENKYISFKFKEIDLIDKKRKYKDVEIVFTSKNSKQVDDLYNHIMRVKAQY